MKHAKLTIIENGKAVKHFSVSRTEPWFLLQIFKAALAWLDENRDVDTSLFEFGDIVRVKAREPMPNSMREALKDSQTIIVADYPFFEFVSGWSVNLERGDSMELVL